MWRFLLRNGLRRGLMGGSRPWLVLGGLAVAVRAVKNLSGSVPEVVFSERLEPGQGMIITHLEQTRKQEAKARRRSRHSP